MKELRTFSIQLSEKICTDGLYEEAKNYIFTCRQFENLLLILIKENQRQFKDGSDANDFKYLTDAFLMQNVLFDYKGRKEKEKGYILRKYSDNKIFQDILKTAKEIGHNNVPSLISKVKGEYKSYFELLKRFEAGKDLPKPPQPKKLSKLKNYSVDLNNANGVSFCRLENMSVLGINLNKGMKYVIHDYRLLTELNFINLFILFPIYIYEYR